MLSVQNIQSIQNRIYEIRGIRVLLDRDLAALYETETKAVNQAVKRKIKRFLKDFMFSLTQQEYDLLRFQFETSKNAIPSRSQIVTLNVEASCLHIFRRNNEQNN